MTPLPHKRMMEIDPADRDKLFSRETPSIKIRPARNGEKNVYVVETLDKRSVNTVNRIVALFAID